LPLRLVFIRNNKKRKILAAHLLVRIHHLGDEEKKSGSELEIYNATIANTAAEPF
jgi:hypothetical protein